MLYAIAMGQIKILSEHACMRQNIRNKITQSDVLEMQFCECSAALVQKYIGLYLTDVRSPSLIVVLSFSASLLNYAFALQPCSVHVAKC